VAQKQRFRYHELRTLAEAFGIKGRKLAPDETDWPTLFRAICDEIHISIIQVDVRVDGLPIAYCNAACAKLTGYSKAEIEGQDCRFLQVPPNRSGGCMSEVGKAGRKGKGQSNASQGPAKRAMRNAIANATPRTLQVINFRKTGTPFRSIVHLHPVHSSEGYVYNIRLQYEEPEGQMEDDAELQKTRETFQKLQSLLPTVAGSLEDLRRAEAAVATDAINIGAIARTKMVILDRRERLILTARRVYSLEWHAALKLLLRHGVAVDGLLHFAQRGKKAQRLKVLIDLAAWFERSVSDSAGSDSVTDKLLSELGAAGIFSVADNQRPLDELLPILGEMAEAAIDELAMNFLPKLIKCAACFPLMESVVSG